MTGEDSQAFEPEAIDRLDDDTDDPAEAFEALRKTVEDLAGDLSRDMTTIRKGVEAAFDRIEGLGPPTDYSADLGRLVQGLAEVQERLKAVEVSPILKNGPEHYARALERSGESLIKTVAQQFQSEARDLQRVARDMANQMASARERRTQNRWLGVPVDHPAKVEASCLRDVTMSIADLSSMVAAYATLSIPTITFHQASPASPSSSKPPPTSSASPASSCRSARRRPRMNSLPCQGIRSRRSRHEHPKR